MNLINPVRPSPIAGSWYSSDPQKLTTEIENYLASASLPELTGQVVGIIAPHAGYFYSGATAGYAYRAVKGQPFDLCVVVSPLHEYLPFPLLTSAHAAYATPLGNLEIDQTTLEEFNQLLIDHSLTTPQPLSNDREHSLEIQLPFLQCALNHSFQILPLMVRSTDENYLQQVGANLAEAIKNKNALLIASTDLSHFYPESSANAYDHVILNRMVDFSPSGVLRAEEKREGFACGSGAVALVLWTAQVLGANQVTLLHHSTSARASGNASSVVGYGALAITRTEVA